MTDLRYESGNVVSPQVHKVGVLAVGSHLENHGAALPIDTDSKIAAYVGLQAALITGAKYLGILYSATEYEYVEHGIHQKPEELVNKQLIPTLRSAKKLLHLDSVVLVNGHGGNVPVKDYLEHVHDETGLNIIFNNKIVEIEGPHAGTGEVSVGELLGILDKTKLEEHCNFEKYPEVGMVGLDKARKAEEGINQGALEVIDTGVCIDLELGESILQTAIVAVMDDVEKLTAPKQTDI
ncbi:MAG: 2-amino-5-formylamino-6-ribosylaminopyrimidin-4(3H)-one 5'-monophosphate deformylase [Methanobacterium sp.]|nr:2-amino-5-formylamino-6-ribosylaminopyrimidin-4(3H)-one 5'-monophosphate deformylase [Methanobacterium sp.]